MSLVRKKKNAESLDGVARHRKMKSAGNHTDFCLMADQSAVACSVTISLGLFERIKDAGGRVSGLGASAHQRKLGMSTACPPTSYCSVGEPTAVSRASGQQGEQADECAVQPERRWTGLGS